MAAPFLTIDTPAPPEYEVTKYRIYEGTIFFEGFVDENGLFYHDIESWDLGCHEVTATWINEAGESDHSEMSRFCLEEEGLSEEPIEEPITEEPVEEEPGNDGTPTEEPVELPTGDAVDSSNHDVGHNNRGCFLNTIM